jgi:hypothetical protein
VTISRRESGLRLMSAMTSAIWSMVPEWSRGQERHW